MASDRFFPLDRRRFLVMSCAGAVAASAPAALAFGDPSATWDGPLRLGFRPEGGLPGTSRRADQLMSGERHLLATGARVTLHGFRGPADELAANGLRHAELQIGFPGERVFTAWRFTSDSSCSTGGACELTVPVEPTGLELSLEIESADPILGRSAGVRQRFASRLVLGSDQGLPKLRSGTYAVPLRQPARGLFCSAPATRQDEPCLILSVEPAATARVAAEIDETEHLPPG